MCYKIRVLDMLDREYRQCDVARYFKVSPKVVRRIQKSRADLLEAERRGVPTSAKGRLQARFPQLEAEVQDFVTFARSQR